MTRVPPVKTRRSFLGLILAILKPIPLALVLFFIVIFASEAPSLASLVNSDADISSFTMAGFMEKFQNKQPNESNEFIDAAISDASQTVYNEEVETSAEQSAESEFDLMREARALFAHYHSSRVKPQINVNQAVQYRGLVEFLSGLIAIYYPKELDPGAIARDIVQVSLEEKADPIFIAALIASESSFRRNAKSHVGARGLMQLMPSTAKIVAKQTKFPKGKLELTDPKTNIRLGVRYIQQLEREYRGNRFKALAAYNWGPGNVGKATRKGRAYPKSVRAYANKIIKQRGKWDSLFKNAQKRAAEFNKNS
jgi:hypothetical protein